MLEKWKDNIYIKSACSNIIEEYKRPSDYVHESNEISFDTMEKNASDK